jgi:thiol:disulfide interchange protein DsbD
MRAIPAPWALLAALMMLPALMPASAKEPAKASLIAESQGFVPGQAFTVALRLALDPGWHTYWRDPGDAGLPTTLQFTLPPGVHVGALQWPKPRVFKAAGDLTCYGYEGKALLLAAITVDPGYSAESLALRAKATWLVCKDICQPGKADVALVLHRQKAFAASAQAPLFARLRPGLGQPPEGYLPSKAR